MYASVYALFLNLALFWVLIFVVKARIGHFPTSGTTLKKTDVDLGIFDIVVDRSFFAWIVSPLCFIVSIICMAFFRLWKFTDLLAHLILFVAISLLYLVTAFSQSFGWYVN